MDDLAGKLNELLNSPDAMARIQNLAGMLEQNQGDSAPTPASSRQQPEGGNLGALASLLSGLGNSSGDSTSSSAIPEAGTLQMVTRLAPLLTAARQEDDHIRLLRALRPLLGKERQKKLDEAIRILQLLRMLPLLRQTGLLSGL